MSGLGPSRRLSSADGRTYRVSTLEEKVFQTPDAEPVERLAGTFPLSRWAALVASWADGMPLPAKTDWDAYVVELVERRTRPEDEGRSAALTLDDPTENIEYNPDGTLGSLEVTASAAWRHVRTVIRHPDAAARLEWEADGTIPGRVAIVGLEADPNPERSCRVLLRAIPLLRDYDWRGRKKPGRPFLTDTEVRHDLIAALRRCQQQGHHQPSVGQLADAHDRRFDKWSDEVGIAETTLRTRMEDHPAPFRQLTPWLPLPEKK
ncbi:MAG: hypothetical protein ACHQZR_00385 [Candidatus Limnocylindrales bacterium]